MAKEKVVLAYSGGLDTTAIIPWLKETYGYDVICACIDVGQESELEGLDERAKYSGAEKLYIIDVVDELCDEYIMPTVQADAVYENKYLLGTSFARPIIAKKLVEVARKEGAVAICHGATGKGNDQLRFELSIKALAPDIKVIATWRQPEWTMQSREDEIAFCKAHGIDLPFDAKHSAVTVTSGTSAMRALSLRILQMSQTTMTFWFSQLHLRRHLMSLSTLTLTSRRATL